MHTASQLSTSQFSICVNGASACSKSAFPTWSEHDRLGVIVDRPLGALGASLAIQLAISMFYDAGADRRNDVLYPEFYVFHVGGRFGAFTSFDFFPPRKEVFVEDSPALILEAINDRAISRLLVVDGPITPVNHHFKEPASARDRIRTILAYSPEGKVVDSDIEITAETRRLEINSIAAINPPKSLFESPISQIGGRKKNAQQIENEIIPVQKDRSGEVSQLERKRTEVQIVEKNRSGLRESYRRVDVGDALRMLSSERSRI